MRPLNQGESATRRDVDTLLRISRRIQEDPERKPKEKKEIVDLLDAAVQKLLTRKRVKGNRAA